MRVLRVSRHRISAAVLREVRQVLDAGGVVAFPTDTAYGLAADPTDAKAVKRIFEIKGRKDDKPLPLIAASSDDVDRFMRRPRGSDGILAAHWPGPLTVIMPLRPRWRDAFVSHDEGRVAVRVPRSAWARAVAEAVGGIVTSTSANRSGGAVPYSGGAVRRQFSGRRSRPDLLLDAGELPERKPSTIISFRNGRIETLRQGPIVIRD